MESEHYDELLSAYLDRELSPEERSIVDRLLARSPQLRQRLEELGQISRLLRTMAPVDPPSDLAEPVLHQIRVQPRPGRPAGRPVGWPWWAGSAAAAALVVAALWLAYHPRRTVPLATSPMPAETARLAEKLPVSPDEKDLDAPGRQPGDVWFVSDQNGVERLAVIVVDRLEGLDELKLVCLQNRIDFQEGRLAESSRQALAANGGLTVLEIEGNTEQLGSVARQVCQLPGRGGPVREVVPAAAPVAVASAAAGTDRGGRTSGPAAEQLLRPQQPPAELSASEAKLASTRTTGRRKAAVRSRFAENDAARPLTESKAAGRPELLSHTAAAGDRPPAVAEHAPPAAGTASQDGKPADTKRLAEATRFALDLPSARSLLPSVPTRPQPAAVAAGVSRRDAPPTKPAGNVGSSHVAKAGRPATARATARLLPVSQTPETLEAVRRMIAQWRKQANQRQLGRQPADSASHSGRRKMLLFILEESPRSTPSDR